MRRALKEIPQEEPRSYVERIRELVEQERIGAARALVAEAVAKGEREEGLLRWQELLAPGRIRGLNPERDIDRTADFRWIRTQGPSYRGQWVALFGGELLAHASSQKAVGELLDARGWESRPGRRALLHFIEND